MNQIKIIFNIIRECVRFMFYNLVHNASIKTDNNIHKMQYTLLRENHIIEKGMSMKNPRKGFGQEKVVKLIIRLGKYFEYYGKKDPQFLNYPLSTINNYISYTKDCGVDISYIEKMYYDLISNIELNGIKLQLEDPAGIETITNESIQRDIKKEFSKFVLSRHSVRYFRDEIPAKSIIDEALNIAQRTPSACNRQGWHTHIYTGKSAHELFKMQGGARGFESDIHMGILVTADANAFLSYEVHQPYVDGGLFSMSLIYAIHAVGLGCIPLSCGFYKSKLDQIKKEYDVPNNEIPIILLGVGYLKDSFKIAISTRKAIVNTNKYHY